MKIITKKKMVAGVLLLVFLLLIIGMFESLNVAPYSINLKPIKATDFIVVVFPEDISEGFERGVLANLSELEQKEIKVYVDDEERIFSREKFTAVPVEGYLGYIENLNIAIMSWGSNTDWESVEYRYNMVSDDVFKVNVIINSKNGSVSMFTYKVSASGTIEPEDMEITIDPVKNLAR